MLLIKKGKKGGEPGWRAAGRAQEVGGKKVGSGGTKKKKKKKMGEEEGRKGKGFGRGRGQGRGRGEKVSAEDLYAELEKYHSEAIQIN